MNEFEELFDAILSGDNKTARAVTIAALAAGTDPGAMVTDCMIPAMDEVGRRFESEEYFVPELLLSGRAMKAAMELIRPLLTAAGAEPKGRVVIGTVRGDLHDIGKNLVAAMLEGGGFNVIDLGADVAPEKIIDTIKSRKVDIVALSALLTVTMPAMKSTIEALKQAGVREQVKVIIGGAPVTGEYARQIGADGFSDNAVGAVSMVRDLIERKLA